MRLAPSHDRNPGVRGVVFPSQVRSGASRARRKHASERTSQNITASDFATTTSNPSHSSNRTCTASSSASALPRALALDTSVDRARNPLTKPSPRSNRYASNPTTYAHSLVKQQPFYTPRAVAWTEAKGAMRKHRYAGWKQSKERAGRESVYKKDIRGKCGRRKEAEVSANRYSVCQLANERQSEERRQRGGRSK